ncbi:MAG: hypothetical protein K9K88_01935 [Desulfobacterales bacterium]|nr:hypothetical protein [Desulfobacterales bacterium]
MELLEGAYDIHVHASPDVVPRAMDLVSLRREAVKAGMAGILIKDHCTCTAGRVAALNQMENGRCRFFSALALNPPVGGINPTAAEAALRAGVDVVYFPTYGAANHIAIWGAGKPPTAFPLPKTGFKGIRIFDDRGAIRAEVFEVLKLIAEHQAVLATGHISPEESMTLIREAKAFRIERVLVTHASEPVTPFPAALQKEAIELGAWIEHAFFAATPSCPSSVSLQTIGEMIRATGVSKVILSSDFGQVENGNPVAAFGRYLEMMTSVGFTREELAQMTAKNPKRLLER